MEEDSEAQMHTLCLGVSLVHTLPFGMNLFNSFLKQTFLKVYFIFMFMSVLPACMSVDHVPSEVRRERQNPWNWCFD